MHHPPFAAGHVDVAAIDRVQNAHLSDAIFYSAD